MDAVADLMKSYFSDKKAHPWHTIYKDIEKYWTRVYPKKDVTETLLLIRDAVFSAFGILSLSIALEVVTSEFVDLFTKASDWKEARSNIRNRCIELVEELVKKRKTRFLVPSALRQDGFGFLVSKIESAELETFKRAKPKMKKVPRKKKEVLDLVPLEKSWLGSRFLREQMVMDKRIEKEDLRIPSLLEAYDHFLVELEIDMSSSIPEPVSTEQITLNGKPIGEAYQEKIISSKRFREKSIQPPLTDFIEERKGKKKRPSGRKKRRAKKK